MKNMLKQAASVCCQIIFNFNSRRSVKSDVVIFESFNGKIPSDSPLSIYQNYVAQFPEKNPNFYWGIKKMYLAEAQKQFPEMQFLVRFSWQWLKIVPRAQYWILNARMPVWLRKNKQTTYIQTWHGTPLKKLGLDIDNVKISGQETTKYHDDFVAEANRWDYLIAPNEYAQNIFASAFQFNNQFIECGYPRNDILITKKDDTSYQKMLKDKLVGPNTERVILYAPTWRDDNFVKPGQYRFELAFDLEKMISLMSKNDVLLLRPHYLVGDTIDISKVKDQVKIVIEEDINELYLISDILITDYSSVMFDFALLERPMIFYAYDYKHYEDQLRGFYFDYSEVPGEIIQSEEDLYTLIKLMFSEDYQFDNEKLLSFKRKFGSRENGKNSQGIVEILENSKDGKLRCSKEN